MFNFFSEDIMFLRKTQFSTQMFSRMYFIYLLNIEFTTILIYLCSPELDFGMPKYIFFTQATMNSYLNMN